MPRLANSCKAILGEHAKTYSKILQGLSRKYLEDLAHFLKKILQEFLIGLERKTERLFQAG